MPVSMRFRPREGQMVLDELTELERRELVRRSAGLAGAGGEPGAFGRARGELVRLFFVYLTVSYHRVIGWRFRAVYRRSHDVARC
jgi:hypothetical protein